MAWFIHSFLFLPILYHSFSTCSRMVSSQKKVEITVIKCNNCWFHKLLIWYNRYNLNVEKSEKKSWLTFWVVWLGMRNRKYCLNYWKLSNIELQIMNRFVDLWIHVNWFLFQIRDISIRYHSYLQNHNLVQIMSFLSDMIHWKTNLLTLKNWNTWWSSWKPHRLIFPWKLWLKKLTRTMMAKSVLEKYVPNQDISLLYASDHLIIYMYLVKIR